MTEDDYRAALINRLKDHANWPSFDNPDFLDALDALAARAAKRRTLDGQLSALLIYNQLAEEMTRLLLECARFYIQLRLRPAEIRFKDPSKPMMGYWIGQLENTIDFDGKDEFIRYVRELNQLRNTVFHGITKHPSAEVLKRRLKPAKKLHDQLFGRFHDSYDWFRLCFKDERKDERLEEIEGEAEEN